MVFYRKLKIWKIRNSFTSSSRIKFQQIEIGAFFEEQVQQKKTDTPNCNKAAMNVNWHKKSFFSKETAMNLLNPLKKKQKSVLKSRAKTNIMHH